MTAPAGTEVCQYPTHAQLIGPVETPPITPREGSSLDAIIVPASRPARNLETAIGLAEAANSHLVLLCSLHADTADVLGLLAKRNFPSATVVQIPEKYRHEFFEFETTEWVKNGPGRVVCAAHDCDLSVKRNVGLMLAQMLGWERVFFLDDDIRDVSAEALASTVSLLGTDGPGGIRYRTVGMTVSQYPDNSVVCHARRSIGEEQDVFVTGSVLAVDSTAPVGFFPDIYNEDWLFFHQDAAAECLTSSGFKANQLSYDPFASPHRAAAQEFGDVIAEGLYAFLHSKIRAEQATVEHWRAFLEDRSRILDEILNRLPGAASEMRDKISKAIESAREKLNDIEPGMCLGYIHAWQRDLDRWAERLGMLPRVDSIGQALQKLKLM